MKLSAHTKVAAVLGWPVEHSLSPEMHNAAFAAMGMDAAYLAFAVHPGDLALAVAGIQGFGLMGVNVTVPHKEAIMPLLDEVHHEAAFIGAVNTVVNHGGRLVGHNTDGRGFMRSLEEAGVDVAGKRVLVVGTGGAARAVSHYLCEESGAVCLWGRNAETSSRLAADLSINFKNIHLLERMDNLADMDVVVNATPLGLKDGDSLPFDVTSVRPGATVVDLIYRETPLLKAAAMRGCKTVHGLGMLLWQGVLAFELWTGEEPPVEVMREALMKGLKSRQ
jgi:shikimate dehydrogenase